MSLRRVSSQSWAPVQFKIQEKSTCDTEQQEGNNETESELQSESSTSASLPLPVGVVPLRSTNTQTLDASRHSRDSSSSSLTSTSSSHSVQQDVHITPPVTDTKCFATPYRESNTDLRRRNQMLYAYAISIEGHVKRLAYPLSFFTYHKPSKKEGNSLYTCTVKGCKRDKPFSTLDNSRGNLRAYVRSCHKDKLEEFNAACKDLDVKKAMTTGLPMPTNNSAKDNQNQLEGNDETQQKSLTQPKIHFSGYRKPLTQKELEDCVTK
ncbi:hypothetical protein OUZ56_012559 [Daphnia magna]|uniref:Uncharacterized protein n=1 Tax=Daphnia magna TaxID=35525 RepID=A0ABQ9Z3C8_9CRUS|nr:hypothetical protein OUZ56_012559 [Daphnia magna]